MIWAYGICVYTMRMISMFKQHKYMNDTHIYSIQTYEK